MQSCTHCSSRLLKPGQRVPIISESRCAKSQKANFPYFSNSSRIFKPRLLNSRRTHSLQAAKRVRRVAFVRAPLRPSTAVSYKPRCLQRLTALTHGHCERVGHRTNCREETARTQFAVFRFNFFNCRAWDAARRATLTITALLSNIELKHKRN